MGLFEPDFNTFSIKDCDMFAIVLFDRGQTFVLGINCPTYSSSKLPITARLKSCCNKCQIHPTSMATSNPPPGGTPSQDDTPVRRSARTLKKAATAEEIKQIDQELRTLSIEARDRKAAEAVSPPKPKEPRSRSQQALRYKAASEINGYTT